MKMDTSEADNLPQTMCEDGHVSAAGAPCTPSSKQHGQKHPVTRTPLSGMSSSLKERLKRCGRYHPATPPSSRRQVTPSCVQQPPTPMLHRVNSSSSTSQGTPNTSSNSNGADHYARSPAGIKRSLPQPRNILKEKSISSNLCEIGQELDSADDCQTSYKLPVIIDKNASERVKSDGDAEKKCFGGENPSSKSDLQNLPVISSDLSSKESVPMESGEILVGDKEGCMQAILVENSGESLRETKRKLTVQLAKEKEMLRKLHMVKTYRAKHDLVKLQTVIEKWRSTSQQAILDLHQLTSEPRPSLTQLVHQLGIDQGLVGYNEESESFEDIDDQ